MLRNLLDEMQRRRLLPVAALALVVLIGAPLLFLKGAPAGAPSADSAAPAAATPAKLPARAARLLAATDAGASGGEAKGTSHDPFNPPASYRAAAAAGAGATGAAANSVTSSTAAKPTTGSATTTTGTSAKPVPVVITNHGDSSSNSNNTTASNPSTSSARTTHTVDIRFGAKKDSKIHRSIPHNKAFYIHGKLVAVFVNYSPKRHAAVFAVAPGMYISGPVKCRVQNGVCKYLDIPAGSYARIAMVTPSKSVVSRRLDVVHTKTRTATSGAKAASADANAACLAGKLVAMERGDALLDRNACKS